MRTHQDWTSGGFRLTPAAAATGPFPTPEFLSTVWLGWQSGDGELMIAESSDALLCFVLVDGALGLVGPRHLVDYRSPLGSGASDLAGAVVDSLPRGTKFVLDSLPAEAAEPLSTGIASLGCDASSTMHDAAAVLSLPATFDDYLTSIGKRERHELRRKRRRYEHAVGTVSLQRATGSGEVFDRFVDLHRRSAGEKRAFMTAPMERFFGALLDLPGWGIDALTTEAGEVAAASFGFVDADGYYLYNSAYDPDLRHLSPGQVMLGALIEQAIGGGRTIFDFLKGDEPYKFRLGATARPLFEIAGIR